MNFSRKLCSGFLVMMIVFSSASKAQDHEDSNCYECMHKIFIALLIGSNALSMKWTVEQMEELKIEFISETYNIFRNSSSINTVQHISNAIIASQTAAIISGGFALLLNSQEGRSFLAFCSTMTAVGFAFVFTENAILWSALAAPDPITQAAIQMTLANGVYPLIASGVFGAPFLFSLLIATALHIRNCLNPSSPEQTPLLAI